jgi:uncharacterized protein (DUF58 family)
LRIVRELLSFEPEGSGTDVKGALQYLNSVIKKRSITFLLSDFIDEGYDAALRIVSKKHDVIAITLRDPREREMPKVGLIKMKDAESGVERWVDTNNIHIQQAFRYYWQQHEEKLKRLFLSTKVDRIDIPIQLPYIKPLVDFFKLREQRL